MPQKSLPGSCAGRPSVGERHRQLLRNCRFATRSLNGICEAARRDSGHWTCPVTKCGLGVPPSLHCCQNNPLMRPWVDPLSLQTRPCSLSLIRKGPERVRVALPQPSDFGSCKEAATLTFICQAGRKTSLLSQWQCLPGFESCRFSARGGIFCPKLLL